MHFVCLNQWDSQTHRHSETNRHSETDRHSETTVNSYLTAGCEHCLTTTQSWTTSAMYFKTITEKRNTMRYKLENHSQDSTSIFNNSCAMLTQWLPTYLPPSHMLSYQIWYIILDNLVGVAIFFDSLEPTPGSGAWSTPQTFPITVTYCANMRAVYQTVWIPSLCSGEQVTLLRICAASSCARLSNLVPLSQTIYSQMRCKQFSCLKMIIKSFPFSALTLATARTSGL